MQKKIRRKKNAKSYTAPNKGLSAVVEKVMNTVKGAELPDFRVGDQVRVHVRIKEGDKFRIQVFEGTVIGQRSTGKEGGTFTVRKMSYGTGVERIFAKKSPKIAKVEVMFSGKVRRAKLYYLRELEGRAARLDRNLESDEGTPAATSGAAVPAAKS